MVRQLAHCVSANITERPSLNIQQTGQVKNDKKHRWKFIFVVLAEEHWLVFIEIVAAGLDT